MPRLSPHERARQYVSEQTKLQAALAAVEGELEKAEADLDAARQALSRAQTDALLSDPSFLSNGQSELTEDREFLQAHMRLEKTKLARKGVLSRQLELDREVETIANDLQAWRQRNNSKVIAEFVESIKDEIETMHKLERKRAALSAALSNPAEVSHLTQQVDAARKVTESSRRALASAQQYHDEDLSEVSERDEAKIGAAEKVRQLARTFNGAQTKQREVESRHAALSGEIPLPPADHNWEGDPEAKTLYDKHAEAAQLSAKLERFKRDAFARSQAVEAERRTKPPFDPSSRYEVLKPLTISGKVYEPGSRIDKESVPLKALSQIFSMGGLRQLADD